MQIFCMDGTTAIKDTVHNLALIRTGTPTYAPLGGKTAPVISASAYTSMSFPTATLSMIPGQDLTFVLVVNTAWPGDDGQIHRLIENYADADNYFLLEKHSTNILNLLVGSPGGLFKRKYMEVDATNWAAETDHVIVATLSADNTQRLWLDGCEAYWEEDANGVRETALAANTSFGCDAQWFGYNLLEGSGLLAIYDGILSDADIDTINAEFGVISTASWTDTGFPQSLDFMGLVSDGAGNIYAAGMDGPSTVWKYDGTNWTDTGGPVFTKDALYADPVYVAFVDPLVFDSTGILYAAVKYCGVYSYNGTTWTKLTGSPADPYALLYEPTQNVLWVGMTDTGVWKYDIEAGTWTDTLLKEGGNYLLSALALAWDNNHDLLYVATNWDGVWVYDGAWTDTGGLITTRPWVYDGPLMADVEALAYNADDDLLYLATDTCGILKYDGATWTSAERYVLEHQWYQIFNIVYDNGFLYTGTSHTGLWRCSPPAADWVRIQGVDAFTNGGWEAYQDDPALNTFGIVRMCFDGTTLYVSTWGNGIWKTDVSPIAVVGAWQGIFSDPPKPLTHKAEKKSAYVSILDPTGSTPLARLTERFPATGWTPDIFENLSFESVNRGGYTVASFTIHRPVTQYWADLQYRNQVIIGRGSEIYWEGYIDKPIRSIRPDVIEVACLGWSAELNQLWTASDITAPVGGYEMSTFINAVLLADPYTHIVAGTIETGDYIYPEGTVFAFAPGTFYFDCIEQLNAGNGYNWGVWGNRAIDLRAKHSSVDWLVWTGDCEDLTISPNPDALCNYALINYTQDGTHYEQVMVQDAASQALYGIIMKRVDVPGKITTAGATQIADLYLESCKDLKVAAEFTCNRIFDSYGAEQYLGKVRGGEVVRIVDWLPTEETLGGVNDIATFEIKSPKYDHDNDTLAITPTEFLPSTDIQIARLQATGY